MAQVSFFLDRESFCAFILGSSTHIDADLQNICHFWIMPGQVLGLVLPCFGNLDFASFLTTEAWAFFLIWSQLYPAAVDLRLCCVDHRNLSRCLAPFLHHPNEAGLLEVNFTVVFVCFVFFCFPFRKKKN